MAKPRPDLPNKTANAKAYVLNFLATLPNIVEVRLAGSRSPLRQKTITAESDWDFLVVLDIDYPFKMRSPRELGLLHADVTIITRTSREAAKAFDTVTVQIWPTDEYGILNAN